MQRKCACGGTSGPREECKECRQKRLQRKIGNRQSTIENDSSVPPIVHEALRSPGQPLDAETRAFFEPRFGHDFGHVRVHIDARAADSARAVSALAYTVGQNIVFGQNEYAPTSYAGRELLAHELAHTIQQQSADGGWPSRATQRIFESSANAAARDISDGRFVSHELPISGLASVRQPASSGELEEEEEEEPTHVPMALPTGKNRRAASSSRPAWRKLKRGPPWKFDPSGFHQPVRPGGRVLTEYQEAAEASSEQMEEAAEQLRGRAQLSKFMARTYKGDMYLGGAGLFHAEYAPSQGTLTISVPIQFTFEDSESEKTRIEGDPKGNKPVTLVTEKEYKTWTAAEIENYRKKFIRITQDTWSSEHTQHTIYSHKPGWESLRVKVVVKVDEIGETTPGADYFQARVYRGDSPEGACGPGFVAMMECVRRGRATFQYDDIGGDAPVVAHEFGHMLGLGDEYKDVWKDPSKAPEASHSRLVYEEFGYGVPRLDETRTDRFRGSIMSSGGKVLPEHGVVFLEAMRQITGIQEWHLRPKGP